MKRDYLAALLAIGALGELACARSSALPVPADVIVLHGKVYTQDARNPWAQAVVIRGEQIILVGSDRESERYRSPKTKIIDAHGHLVLPGLWDSHIHFMEGSLGINHLHVDGQRNLAEIQSALREFAVAHPDDPWLVGRGWTYAAIPGSLPDKKDLDAVVADRPVFLDGFDSHTAWANSRALQLAGVTRATADPPDGKIVRDAHGEPTGALQEGAANLVIRVIPKPSPALRLVALRRGMALANRVGLTSVITCGDSAASASDHLFSHLYRELQKQEQLTLRLYMGANLSPLHPLGPQLDELEQLRSRDRPDDDWIATGAAKIFLDGVVEGHTAAMLAPYADDPSKSGALQWDPVTYKESVGELDRRGFQVFTHAIGDAAVRLALDAYEQAQRKNATRDARHRIEHIETIAAADIPRFGALGVIASFQPLHARPDDDTLNVWRVLTGPERAQRAWAWQSIARAGGRLAFGSDWPVASLDPWQGMQVAVTRQNLDGNPAQGWVPEQRLSVAAAVAGYTIGAAVSGRREKRLGSLEAGKLADLIIVSQNVFEVDPHKIAATQVLLTMVGGRTVYQAGEGEQALN